MPLKLVNRMSWSGLEENKRYQLVEEQVYQVESSSRTVNVRPCRNNCM